MNSNSHEPINETSPQLSTWVEKYPEKFVSLEQIFRCIRRGDRIFIGSGCGEPRFLVHGLIEYVKTHPNAIFDAEVMHIWSLGLLPYTDSKFKANFRLNTFFVDSNNRETVNQGLSDYTPVFLSEVPTLFEKKLVSIDVALIQTTLPDDQGNMSLGVSVDIVKSAAEAADIVIVQVNELMPRTLGNSFIHISEVDFIIHKNELIPEVILPETCPTFSKIGNYVARLIDDGDTIQVGYGSIPNAIMSSLEQKKNLGVHSEMISDGIIDLMRKGAVDNSRKSVHQGKTVAAFCMGSKSTYDYIHNNPSFQFEPIGYTNCPIVIAQNEKMVAINSALQIDLTGQSTAECIGSMIYSGIGGQSDFMRGALFSKKGKSILCLQSTAQNGEVSRIVPYLESGVGVTLTRGDIHYVVTEYGIAYIHGKNIRERAMALVAIAHPKFRPHLIAEAKKLHLIYKDQAFISGKRGEYPSEFETVRTTKDGTTIQFRPVKISDEPLMKEFFYSLSDQSRYRRFVSNRKDMPHERLQSFTVIDYTKEMIILATIKIEEREILVGFGQYGILESTHIAEVAFVVRDDYQNKGIGAELLKYLILIGHRHGLLGLRAEVLVENQPMLHLFKKLGFGINKNSLDERTTSYELNLKF